MTSDQPLANESPIRVRPLVLAIAATSVVGLGLAAELAHVHHMTHTAANFHAVCTLSERVNCQTVAMSWWSEFAGVPVAVWGLVAYAVYLGLAAWALVARPPQRSFPFGLFAAMSVVGVGSSVFLAFISLAVLRSICIFCFALYGVNFAIAALTAAALWRTRTGPLAALSADLNLLASRPAVSLPLVGLLLAVIAALVALSPDYSNSPPSASSSLGSGTTDAGEHWIGAATPALTIVEFTDYECPHCRRAHRELRHRLEQLGDRVRVVHKHYPLDQACNPGITSPFHDRACEFSAFVECCGEQGQFWPANDAVFGTLDNVAAVDVDLQALAADIGVDWTSVQTCMAAPSTAAAILRDITDGDAMGIEGTPSFAIDGQLHVGAVPGGLLDAASAPR